VGGGKDGGAAGKEPDLAQVVRRHAEVALQQQLPDEADSNRRDHHGDEKQRREEPLALDEAPDEEGERKSEHELDQDRRQHEPDGEPEGAPEDRVMADEMAEVVEP